MITQFLNALPNLGEEQDYFTGGFVTGLIRQSFKQGYNHFSMQAHHNLMNPFSGLGGQKDRYLCATISGEISIGRAQYCALSVKSNIFYLPDARDCIFTVEANDVRLTANNREKGHELRNVTVKSKNFPFLQKVLEHYRCDQITNFNGSMGYGPTFQNSKLVFINGDI